MTNYEKLIQYLPDVYKKTNNLYFLQGISKQFDILEAQLESLNKTWLIDYAEEGYLDVIGGNIGIYRAYLQTDDIYRRRIKIAMYNLYFVPTLNNFIYLIEKIIGYQALNIKEGWNLQAPFKESAVLQVEVVVPAGETQELLTDMEKIYSAGVRVDWKEQQEVFAIYEMFGEINNTGLQDIGKYYDRSVIPITYKIYAPNEQVGEHNNTGTTEIYTSNTVLGGI